MMTTSTTRGRMVKALVAGTALSALALWTVPSDAHATRTEHGARVGETKKAKSKAPAQKPAPSKGAQPPAGSYTFMNRSADGSPVRYNPCAAIHYVVNAEHAPPSGLADVRAAFDRLASATGLTFVDDGQTDEIAATDRGSQPNPRYPGRFDPILVGFYHPGESPMLDGSQMGVGGSVWYENAAHQHVYVTGVVAIDADQVAAAPAGFGSATSVGVVVLHELGHVAGLGHASTTAEVMYPTRSANGTSSWGSGDRAGLSQLGTQAGCEQSPAYPF